MFIDARAQPDGSVLKADVCIIGAGAAGLSLAHSLLNSGLRVLIVESGGRTEEPDAPDLGGGSSNDADYPFLTSRARGFGGTTARWYGASIPLDPSDFEQRPWVPHSGWPLTATDLAPHIDRAKSLLGIPDRPLPPLSTPIAEGAIAAKPIWIAKPLNLGDTLAPLLADHPTVHCLLNATVTRLEAESPATVRMAEVATPNTRLRVQARCFVLATGGIENARLLLNTQGQTAGGLGNAHDTLGRYHMEHPLITVGLLRLTTGQSAALPFTNHAPFGQTRVEHTFGLSAAMRAEHQLLDLHIRAYRYSPREAHPAVIAAKALTRDRSHGLGRFLRRHGTALPGQLAPYALWHLNNKWRRQARFDHLRLSAFIEVEPRPENRVTLSDRRDRYGQPLPHLHYTTTPQALDSVQTTMRLMAADLAKRGIGELRHAPADIAHLTPYNNFGLHQMGTTRMAGDPRHGVVDADCRVHGVNNLFVAGSSVFPTGGAANPTLTIAALSLRLGETILRHLPTLD